MKTLSIQRPRPSIEIRTPASINAPGETRAGEASDFKRASVLRFFFAPSDPTRRLPCGVDTASPHIRSLYLPVQPHHDPPARGIGLGGGTM